MSTQEGETKEVHFVMGGTAPAPGLHADAATALRVQRFFTKLFQEATAMGATHVSFLHGDDLRIVFFQDKQSLKTVSIGPHWLPQLLGWMSQRRSYLRAGERFGERPSLEAMPTWDFPIDAALTDIFVRARVRVEQKLSKAIDSTLSELRIVRWEEVADSFALSAHSAEMIAAAGRQPTGLIVLAAPAATALPGAVASMSAMVDAAYLGDAAESIDKAAVIELAARQRIMISTVGKDPAEILLSLVKGGWPIDQLSSLLVFIQGFARRICAACSRPGILEGRIIDELPPALQPPPENNYRVGKGCAACLESGYDGLVGFQSVTSLSRADTAALAAMPAPSEEGIIKLLTPRIRPLLEDGTEKAYRGLLTLDEVLLMVRSANHEYFRSREPRVEPVAAEALPIDQDFFFQKPAETAEQPLRGKEAFSGKKADEPLFHFGPGGRVRERPSLLVVEDDPDQRSILEMMLKSASYDVTIAGDGVEALDCLKKDTPDLIVTDLMMPRLDGRGLVTKLKEHRTYSKIPVLVLTVLDDSDQEYALLDLGVDDYCEKNIQRKILLKRIENVLRRAGVVRNAAAAPIA